MTSSGAASSRDRWPVPAIDAADFARTVVALSAAAEAAAAASTPGPWPELGRYAIVASFVGRFEDAERFAGLLAERARAANDAPAGAYAELAVGVRALFLGDHTVARVHLARAAAPGGGGPGPATYAASVAAEVELYAGDGEQAEGQALGAAEAAHRDGDTLAHSCALLVAGLAAARQGRAADAYPRLRASLDAAVVSTDARSLMRAIEGIGLLESDPPGPALALRLLTAAGRHRRRLDLARPKELASRVALRLGELRYILGDSPFEEGVHAGRQLSLTEAAALARRGTGG